MLSKGTSIRNQEYALVSTALQYIAFLTPRQQQRYPLLSNIIYIFSLTTITFPVEFPPLAPSLSRPAFPNTPA